MNRKSTPYHLDLTPKEFKVLGIVLDNYLTDCSVQTKTVSAVERIVKKIIKEAIQHQGEE